MDNGILKKQPKTREDYYQCIELIIVIIKEKLDMIESGNITIDKKFELMLETMELKTILTRTIDNICSVFNLEHPSNHDSLNLNENSFWSWLDNINIDDEPEMEVIVKPKKARKPRKPNISKLVKLTNNKTDVDGIWEL